MVRDMLGISRSLKAVSGKTMKKLLYFTCLFLAGCVQPNAPEPTQETTQNDAKTESWQEIADGKVEFVKMFPGAAQKNVYLTWKLFENTETKSREYRVDNKPISQEATQAVEALIQSVDSNLIPSDGIYACRYEENQPQFRVELNKNGHHYSLISSSDCLHAAPFNIRLDIVEYADVACRLGSVTVTGCCHKFQI